MKDFAGNLYHYCEELYNVNKKIIELVALDARSNHQQIESNFLFISCGLMRLIPCRRKNDKLYLMFTDGILSFKEELSFLEHDYNQLFADHHDLLKSIKDIRNKTEHCPHKLNLYSILNDPIKSPTICFNLHDQDLTEEYRLDLREIVLLIKGLNKVFDKILEEFRIDISKNHSEKLTSPYCKKITGLEYEKFNRILESALLYDISNLMQNF